MKSRCVHHFPLAILFFHFFNYTRWRDLHHDEVFWVLVIFFIILLQEWRVHLEDPVFTIDLKTIYVHLPWACSVLKCQSLTKRTPHCAAIERERNCGPPHATNISASMAATIWPYSWHLQSACAYSRIHLPIHWPSVVPLFFQINENQSNSKKWKNLTAKVDCIGCCCCCCCC